MSDFVAGQRWLSTAEPELGLGVVTEVEFRTIRILFPAADEVRMYASESAPLRRLILREGDVVKTGDDEASIKSVIDREDGTVAYLLNDGKTVGESLIQANAGLHGPEDRLRAGIYDDTNLFQLRAEAWDWHSNLRQRRGWGLSGARMSLIPHQLHVAERALARPNPRVLLADEVGLGKTIEAGLIIHSLLATNRAERILILVPSSLIHQWFVEMLRRFNLRFSIVDEDRYDDSAADDPFADRQLVLCTQQILGASAERQRQVLAADWDMVVVDEAHHVAWHPDNPSPDYRLLAQLAAASPGLILVTATPDQLGLESHFGRLRLLDPDRFDSFSDFLADQDHFRELAATADRILDAHPLTPSDCSALAKALPGDPPPPGTVLDADERSRLLDRLIDRHGTGRVVFRNTRAVISGFPKRRLHPVPLQPPAHLRATISNLPPEHTLLPPDQWPATTLADDPRSEWLVQLLRSRPDTKFLLIAHRRETIIALDKRLQEQLAVKTARFHEDLSLVQRDRNAAWFAEPDGARLLLCSEIGSEGRNFQFVQHLILFDLPADPELLEQRIGRLDRIGQSGDVHLHVPFWNGTGQEILYRWYDAAGAFAAPLRGGHLLLEALGDQVADTAAAAHRSDADEIADELESLTIKVAGEIRAQLESGRDRLLEYNSFRRDQADALVAAVSELDDTSARQTFMERVFEGFGIRSEELSFHCSLLQPTSSLLTDAFPAIPEEGVRVAWDRARAAAREDAEFLSWEHPIVTGALDLLTGSEHGNCAAAFWPADQGKLLLLETIWIVAPIAPASLHADQYLPPSPIRFVVDHGSRDRTGKLPLERLADHLHAPRNTQFFQKPEIRDHLLPGMLTTADDLANAAADELRRQATAKMRQNLDREIARLRELAADHGGPASADADALANRRDALAAVIADAPLRLDAVRLIWRGPKT